MQLSRLQLRRVLDALRLLDSSASPYIGLQFTDHGLAYYRTSNLGYVRSIHYTRGAAALVVSFGQLAQTLDAIRSDDLELEVDSKGVLQLSHTDDMGTSEVHVHTLRIETAWAKTHTLGAVTKELDPLLFRGINARPYTMTAPPVMKASRLMLPTDSGIVMRHGLPAGSTYPYPRESFLKSLHDLDVRRLLQTEEGYWVALTEGFELVTAGHRTGDALFDTYSTPADQIAEIPSARFLSALDSAIRWADESVRIEINSKTGQIETKNSHNAPGQFSFGTPAAWKPFAVSSRMAKTLATTMTQSTEELIQVSQADSILRFTRGLWEIHQKVFW